MVWTTPFVCGKAAAGALAGTAPAGAGAASTATAHAIATTRGRSIARERGGTTAILLSRAPDRKYHRSADPGLPVERLHTPHVVPGRRGRAPRAIVVHTTVGSFASAAGWFADPSSGVSAHYLVALDGRIAQFVDEHDAARHTRAVRPATSLHDGDDPNLYTIGIEFEDGGAPEAAARTAPQYAAGGALVRGIAGRWSIPLDRDHLIGHRELDASQSCPGNLDLNRLLAAALDERRSAAGRRTEAARLAC